jgi:hypothetical protein
MNDSAVTPGRLASIARRLLPLGPAGCPDTLFLPPPGGFPPNAYIDSTESDPVRVSMRLHRSEGSVLPAFELRAGFELTSAPALRMPPPGPSAPLLLRFPETRYSAGRPTEPPAECPFIPGSALELTIVVFPGVMRFSTVRFVGAMLNECFDNIWTTGDLGRFDATAVRCRQRSVFRNAGGTYFAIIAFDAVPCRRQERCIVKPLTRNREKDALQVRYLITMKADADIEAKAERILQNVLARFGLDG